jgi:2-polyprenyl-6-methoxyphenol hydroxylase-like FAD-dependent oxidoreductase
MSARPILETTTNMALREIRQKPAQAEAPGTAVIAGASLAGMMAALTLSRAGLRVTMLERSDDSARTGAALSADPELLRRLTLRGSRAAQALRTYERMRLSTARSVVQSGQQFSRLFAGRHG